MADNFDYRLRLAKNVERKLILELLASLDAVQRLSDCQYIGFGSIWFADFRMMHKRFAFSEMTSIERSHSASRCELNSPYGCVSVRPGHSNQVLPALDWSKPAVAWLDYTCMLKGSVIEDLKTVCYSASPMSLLFITINVGPRGLDPVDERHVRFSNMVGDYATPGLKAEDLQTSRDVAIQARMSAGRILTTALGVRAKAKAGDLVASQVAFYTYGDGDDMATLGYVLHAPETAGHLEECGVYDVGHCRREGDPYHIDPPLLTPTERALLDTTLPIGDAGALEAVPEVADMLGAYRKFYRHYPAFTEVLEM